MKVLRFIGQLAQMILAFAAYAFLQEAYIVPSKAKITTGQELLLALATIVVIVFIAWMYRRQLRDQGNDWFFNAEPHWTVRRLFIAFFGFVLIVVGQILFIKFIGKTGTSQNQAALDTLRTQSSPLFNIMLVVVAPICEELIFRGMFFNTFFTTENQKNKWFGILICGFVFAFFHDPHLTKYFLLYWMMGVILSWLYLTTRDLRYPILAHMLNNLLGVL